MLDQFGFAVQKDSMNVEFFNGLLQYVINLSGDLEYRTS